MAARQIIEPKNQSRRINEFFANGPAICSVHVGRIFRGARLGAIAQRAESLYDRLGGLKGITVVVDDFVNRLVANKELNKNPAIDAG